MHLDRVLEEEIKKEMNMRNWEQNGDPIERKLFEENVRKEVTKRLQEAGDMTDFNRYLIDQHGRQRERQVEVGKLEV